MKCALCDRLRNGDKGQYLFMPYNPKDHWILIVFNMKRNEVFYLYPLGKAPDTDLERLLNMY
ncbi:hypothetical protein RND71_037211 [Anisodus tanguticus]|uniref:Ubiquitin-like protease family profile domain-containing protein n=1 Tax=Anisodus tanguticus TaxID=243964 RepID=A0AAE1R5H2_9SOLA|nr:hypothetical protein RND71_037211 [Anisodus tanguticus]